MTKSHLIQDLTVPKLRTLHVVGKMPSNGGNAGRACAKVLRQGVGNQGRMMKKGEGTKRAGGVGGTKSHMDV